MKIDRDAVTGCTVRRYTTGPERHAKLYFSTENFSADDQYFFFTTTADPTAAADPVRAQSVRTGLCRAHVETGEITLLADDHYSCFAMHWNENKGVLCRDDGMIMRIDIETGEMTPLGRLPAGAKPSGHLTIADDGRVACAVQLENKIYALVTLDPGQTDAQIVYMTDQWLGHTQICPTDSNLLFYVHETGGDALQRTWMFDVRHRMNRPYYVEHPDEWITHETWRADGRCVVFMRIPGQILIGDKDGRHFDVVYTSPRRILHPGVSRDGQWLCTDTTWTDANGVCWGVELVNPRTGKSKLIASMRGECLTGADHLHPSFNRAGDKILFSAHDESGVAQVCVVELDDVERP